MDEYNKGWAVRAEQEPDDEIIRSGVSPDNIRKWKVNIHRFFFKMDCECYYDELLPHNPHKSGHSVALKWSLVFAGAAIRPRPQRDTFLPDSGGQLRRDGPHHLHAHGGVGLLALLSSIQVGLESTDISIL